jgi:hypothetical protein
VRRKNWADNRTEVIRTVAAVLAAALQVAVFVKLYLG